VLTLLRPGLFVTDDKRAGAHKEAMDRCFGPEFAVGDEERLGAGAHQCPMGASLVVIPCMVAT
jgi:hypothetical protein